MSNAAMSCAWEADDRPRASGALFVLIVLADHASDHSGENWGAFPSVGRICERTELSRGAVERHLKALEAAGWITRKRRVRPDGKLGIYDYTLHRRAAERAALQAERSGALDASIEGLGEGVGEIGERGSPCSKMEHGPCADLGAAMLQNGAQPCAELEHQEPLLEPSEEPPQPGAREPGDFGFEKAIAAWPTSGRKFTRWAKAREAWAWACSQVDPSALHAAVVACATDPDLAKGDHAWGGFDKWLLDERFRAFLPSQAGRGEPRTAFAVDPVIAALRAEVEAYDAASAVELDRAAREGFAIRPKTRWAFERLRVHAAAAITRHGFELIEPAIGGTP